MISDATGAAAERPTGWLWDLALAPPLLVLALLIPTSAVGCDAAIHTNLEVVATVLAFVVGILALVRYYARASDAFLFLSLGFLGTALLDGYHAAVTATYLAPYLPSALPSLVPWSWLVSRVCLGSMLVLALRQGSGNSVRARNVYLLGAGLTLGSFAFFALVPLPQAYFPGSFLGRPEDLVPGALFLAAFVLNLRTKAWRGEIQRRLIGVALLLNVVAQLAIMPFSQELFDAQFLAAHALKLSSYACVGLGLLHSVHTAFRLAGEKADQLEAHVLVRTAELERSNEALEGFAHVAAHDLRSPLRDMSGLASWVLEDAGEQLPPESVAHLEKIRGRAAGMTRLLDGLLEYSKAGRLEQPEQVEPLQVLAEIDALLQRPPGLRLELPASAPSLRTPRAALEQVLRNLISNAISHHDRAEGHVSVIVEERDELVAFHVSDDGPGIPPALHEKAFGMFQRLAVGGSGSGLGLAMARKLVLAHGGELRLSSSGRGSTFTFTWPRESRGAAQDLNA